jgi:hypothetical protein
MDNNNNDLSVKYSRRFGTIAVEMGFVTAEDIKEALNEQFNDDLSRRPHRLLGRILVEKGLMSIEEMEAVLEELFKAEKNSQKL